jgi:hypothetical protein
MNAQALLFELLERGVTLTAAGSSLEVDAPTGALTAADRALLAAHKAALLKLLCPPAPPPSWSATAAQNRGPALASKCPELMEALAAIDARAARLVKLLGIPQPEAQRLAWEEQKRLEQGDPPQPIVWSDPDAPPLELFDQAIPLADVEASLEGIAAWNDEVTRHPIKTNPAEVWQYARLNGTQRAPEEELEADQDDDDEAYEPEPQPPPDCRCKTCWDSAAVVPDAFGTGEPWPLYLWRIRKVIEKYGKNPMIHPLPCPACWPVAAAEARERLRAR